MNLKNYAVILMVFSLSTCSKNRNSEPINPAAGTGQANSQEIKLSYEQRLGHQQYVKYCAVCHGKEGKGDGFNAYNLDPKPVNFTDTSLMNKLDDARLFKIVHEGGIGAGCSSLMPTWGGRLSKNEIEFVIAYIRLFGKQK